MSEPDIAQWLRRLKADGDVDGLADRLRAGTGGNPLFVRMLLERGPAALDDGLREFPELRHLVLAHLRGLGDSARELTLDAARAEFVAGHIEACLRHCQTTARLAEDAGRPDILAAAALVIPGVGDPAMTSAVEALCAKAIRAGPAEDAALRVRLISGRRFPPRKPAPGTGRASCPPKLGRCAAPPPSRAADACGLSRLLRMAIAATSRG